MGVFAASGAFMAQTDVRVSVFRFMKQNLDKGFKNVGGLSWKVVQTLGERSVDQMWISRTFLQ